MIRSFQCALAVLLLVAAATTVQAVDTIRTLTDSVRGDIVEMSPTEVVVESRGVSRKVPVNTIVSIRFDEEPDGLGDAKVQIRSGQLSEALQMLRGIDIESIDRDVVKQEIQFWYCYCSAQLALGGVGTPRDAGGLMNNFLSKNPGNFHYFEANEIMADLLVAAGRPDTALTFLERASKAPWPETQLRLALARARGYQAQGNHAQAIKEYEKVLKSSLQGPQVKRYRLQATLGKAAGLAEINQGQAGIGVVKNVIKAAEKGDTEIHARAYNALGDCYRTMEKPKEAVIQYLHVDALYYQHPALHAEALARIVKLWELMERPERAAQARKTLTSRYPNSKWTKIL